jgi:MoaA/NifB/PqqE/SkfB family radical SAM enzyme
MAYKIKAHIAKQEFKKLLGYLTKLKLKKIIKQVHICFDYILYSTLKQRISKLPYPPRHISIMLTGFCNNKCVFCCHHAENSKNNKYTSHLYETFYTLSMKDYKDMVDKAYEARVPHIHICSSGEPTIHPKFLEMLDYAIHKFDEVSFQSNFTGSIYKKKNLINEIKKRAKYISYITTDIMGYDKKLHEKIKLGSKFDDMVNAMQKISKDTGILIHIHVILTKHNYKDLDKLVKLLHKKEINFRFDVVNLEPYNFNEFSSVDAPYTSKDIRITEELKKVKKICEQLGILYSLPIPYDLKGEKCRVFWDRLQVNYPSHDLPKEKWTGNCLPGACNAVVRGKIRTIGNITKAKSLWDVWNGEILTKIRKNLIKNKYPDKECYNCQFYKK